MARITVRKGMPSVQLDKAQFAERLKQRFRDPAFEPLQTEIDKIIDAAWDGYDDSRKAPYTRPAGPGLRRSEVRTRRPTGSRQRDAIRRGRATAEVADARSRACC